MDRLRKLLRAAQWLGILALGAALSLEGHAEKWAAGIGLTLLIIQFVVSHLLRRTSLYQIARHEALARDADTQRQQVQLLFGMTDMLQSAESHEDVLQTQ